MHDKRTQAGRRRCALPSRTSSTMDFKIDGRGGAGRGGFPQRQTASRSNFRQREHYVFIREEESSAWCANGCGRVWAGGWQTGRSVLDLLPQTLDDGHDALRESVCGAETPSFFSPRFMAPPTRHRINVCMHRLAVVWVPRRAVVASRLEVESPQHCLRDTAPREASRRRPMVRFPRQTPSPPRL